MHIEGNSAYVCAEKIWGRGILIVLLLSSFERKKVSGDCIWTNACRQATELLWWARHYKRKTSKYI